MSTKPVKKNESKTSGAFCHASRLASTAMGSPWGFATAAAVIVAWVASGPFYHYSDTWQLIINTGTTIVTFLMVFLIQNTQNRDARAIHLKLDEVIRAVHGARNSLIDLETLDDEALDRLTAEFKKLQQQKAARKAGRRD